jgi:chromosome segregation ATPase
LVALPSKIIKKLVSAQKKMQSRARSSSSSSSLRQQETTVANNNEGSILHKLQREIETLKQKNEELSDRLLSTREQSAEALKAVANHRAAADNLQSHTALVDELKRLRDEAARAEAEATSWNERADQAVTDSQAAIRAIDDAAMDREVEIERQMKEARSTLSELQRQAQVLRGDAGQLGRLQQEATTLRNRLGKSALPLHKQLFAIQKETKAANAERSAEIQRVKTRRDALLAEVSALLSERVSLQSDLKAAVDARKEADKISLELANELLVQESGLLTQRAIAARSDPELFTQRTETTSSNQSTKSWAEQYSNELDELLAKNKAASSLI